MSDTVPLLYILGREMIRQDEIHPDGYPATRDGVRLGIAAAEDELAETREAWIEDRCKCCVPRCEHASWEHVRSEAIQAAAVLMRMVRSINERLTCSCGCDIQAHPRVPTGTGDYTAACETCECDNYDGTGLKADA